MTHLFIVSGLFLLALQVVPSATARAAQAPGAAIRRTTLAIGGDVTKPTTLTVADLRDLPRTAVKIDEDGRAIVYEGVLVGELLRRAGAPVGSELRANAMATYVLASANDGYQVVFSLAELDPGLTSNEIIVADTIDGMPLAVRQGPLRIVVPKDARTSRHVRMLERIDVVRLRK